MKVTMSLKEVLELNLELQHLNREKINFITKHQVNQAAKVIETDVESYSKLRKEAIENIDKETGEVSDKIKKELEDLLAKEAEYEFVPFKMSELEKIESEVPYSAIFKIVK
jgi:hypothetical protein